MEKKPNLEPVLVLLESVVVWFEFIAFVVGWVDACFVVDAVEELALVVVEVETEAVVFDVVVVVVVVDTVTGVVVGFCCFTLHKYGVNNSK